MKEKGAEEKGEEDEENKWRVGGNNKIKVVSARWGTEQVLLKVNVIYKFSLII